MNQQDKQLLLTDICSRLPYGVFIQSWLLDDDGFEAFDVLNGVEVFANYDVEIHTVGGFKIESALSYCKPILFPISCLTQEITINGESFVPMEELFIADGFTTKLEFDTLYIHATMTDDEDPRSDEVDHWLWFDETSNFPFWVIELLNEWHFDYRGLIDKGLAVSVYSLDKNPYE